MCPVHMVHNCHIVQYGLNLCLLHTSCSLSWRSVQAKSSPALSSPRLPLLASLSLGLLSFTEVQRISSAKFTLWRRTAGNTVAWSKPLCSSPHLVLSAPSRKKSAQACCPTQRTSAVFHIGASACVPPLCGLALHREMRVGLRPCNLFYHTCAGVAISPLHTRSPHVQCAAQLLVI